MTLLHPRTITEFLLNYRTPVLIVLIVLTLFLAAQLRHAEFSREMHGDLPQGDPELIYFEKFAKQFGDSEIVVIAVESDQIFTPAGIAWLKQLTDRLAESPWVKQVLSLTTAQEIKTTLGLVHTKALIEDLPETIAAAQDIRRRALEHPEWVKTLISADGRYVALNLLLPSFTDDSPDRLQAVTDLRAIIAANANPAMRVHLTGVSAILLDSLDMARQDMTHFMWLTPLMIVLLLFAAFRTLRGIVIPLLVIGMAVVWTIGLYFMCGNKITMVSTMLPTLIAVICISDVIHILTYYYHQAGRLGDRRATILATMEHMTSACFLTSLTTALGFVSLAVSQIKSVRVFGCWAALGILLAYLLAISVTPLLLSFLPLPPRSAQERYDNALLSALLRRIAAFVERDKLIIPLLIVVALTVSTVAALQLRVETQMSTFLPDASPSKIALKFIDKNFSGFSTLEVTVQGAPKAFAEPWAIAELGQLQSWLAAQPEVDSVISYRDLVVKMHQSFGSGTPEKPLPETAGEVEEYLLMFSMSDQAELLNAFVTPDYTTARISARLKARSSEAQRTFIDKFEADASKLLDARLQFRTTGALKLFIAQVTALVLSQIRSFALTSFVIMFVLAIYFRSLKLSVIAMIPNELPTMMTMGLMGVAGITLNLSTVMISCVAIGISVDDTIHFLSHYRHEFAQDGDAPAAIRRTLAVSGRAVVFTSLILAGGFSVFALSNFGPNRYFGILTSFTMITALFSELLLTPYLVRVFRLR